MTSNLRLHRVSKMRRPSDNKITLQLLDARDRVVPLPLTDDEAFEVARDLIDMLRVRIEAQS